MKAFPGI